MQRDICWAIAFASLGLAAWFIAGDVLFSEVTLGKVAFSLVPALAFGFLSARGMFK